jgi:hypothetical protein
MDANGKIVWVHHDGSAGEDLGYAIGHDPLGRIVVAGSVADTLDLGVRTIGAGNGPDGFVTALDPSMGLE